VSHFQFPILPSNKTLNYPPIPLTSIKKRLMQTTKVAPNNQHAMNFRPARSVRMLFFLHPNYLLFFLNNPSRMQPLTSYPFRFPYTLSPPGAPTSLHRTISPLCPVFVTLRPLGAWECRHTSPTLGHSLRWGDGRKLLVTISKDVEGRPEGDVHQGRHRPRRRAPHRH
jgi:hypothetical protein